MILAPNVIGLEKATALGRLEESLRHVRRAMRAALLAHTVLRAALGEGNPPCVRESTRAPKNWAYKAK